MPSPSGSCVLPYLRHVLWCLGIWGGKQRRFIDSVDRETADPDMLARIVEEDARSRPYISGGMLTRDEDSRISADGTPLWPSAEVAEQYWLGNRHRQDPMEQIYTQLLDPVEQLYAMPTAWRERTGVLPMEFGDVRSTIFGSPILADEDIILVQSPHCRFITRSIQILGVKLDFYLEHATFRNLPLLSQQDEHWWHIAGVCGQALMQFEVTTTNKTSSRLSFYPIEKGTSMIAELAGDSRRAPRQVRFLVVTEGRHVPSGDTILVPRLLDRVRRLPNILPRRVAPDLLWLYLKRLWNSCLLRYVPCPVRRNGCLERVIVAEPMFNQAIDAQQMSLFRFVKN
ncbi:hypothetical protein Slin15195_G082930 [Septoria linicola]|uniref:Uncharacterized protein n=1 Tax=Septoria linicola TaxID=215465 RepID=A0A9Q9EM18_9PEZI|nr:hypothetical protein Slin15195_G082930 [Septoria linicola]